MGDSPTFNAMYIGQNGLKDNELGQRYLIQVDVDSSGRLFVDITNIVNRAANGTLPHEGEYFVDQSDDWFDKHGDGGEEKIITDRATESD